MPRSSLLNSNEGLFRPPWNLVANVNFLIATCINTNSVFSSKTELNKSAWIKSWALRYCWIFNHCSLLTKSREKVKNSFRLTIICVHILREGWKKKFKFNVSQSVAGVQHMSSKPRVLFWIITRNSLLARAVQSFSFKLYA